MGWGAWTDIGLQNITNEQIIDKFDQLNFKSIENSDDHDDMKKKNGKTEKRWWKLFCPGIQIAKTIFNYGIWKKIDLWNIGQVTDSTALVSITSLKPEELRVTTENNMKNKQEILTACSVILTFELKNTFFFFRI